MKVLIIHPCKGFYGGAEEVVVQMSRYLTAHEHQATLLTTNLPPDMQERLPKGLSWIVTPEYLGMWQYAHSEIGKYDIVNAHNFPATLTTFPTKKPIVWYCHEPPELFANWRRKPVEAFNRWWVRKSGTKVVVADQMNAHRFFRIYGVEPQVVPYGVDCEFWSKGISFTKEPGRIRLLQVGAISLYKNQLVSILSLFELLETGLDATLTLIGSIADERYYRSLVENIDYAEHTGLRGCWGRITFEGQKTQEEVRGQFRVHDILLHPVEGKGGWLVPFEAMCAGLPVLTTPKFSASALITQNELGIVTGNLADAILRGRDRELDTEAIRLWVKENLTWTKFGEGMIRMFEEVIRA